MSRLQAIHRKSAAPESGTLAVRARRFLFLATMMLVALLIVACADDSDNRQFANDPVTPRPTATTPLGTPETAAPVEPAAPLASPETLVDRRGAPSVIYAQIAGQLWSFDGDRARQVSTDDVAAYAASPSGLQVAVVTTRYLDAETVFRIIVYESDGDVVHEFEDVLRVGRDSATPVPDFEEAVHLSWAPQGRRLLLSHVSGQLVDIPFDGKVEEIETRTSIAGVIQAEWSPRGDQIGLVRRSANGGGLLSLVDPGQEPARVNVIAPVGVTSGPAKSVEAFAWRPSGDGVLFLQGQRDDAGVTHAQLLSWDYASNTTRVIATGGQGGPTGSITSFAIAPDGKAVAYTISFRSGSEWAFSGLFVRSLKHGQVYRVPIAGDATVIAVRWMRDGLAWGMVGGAHSADESVTFQRIDRGGNAIDLGSVVQAPAAPPVASPVAGQASASPVAAPATPGASPVASPPVATPVSGS